MEVMLDLSVEAPKTLMYLQEYLLKEASTSKFLMSKCLWSEGFKEFIKVKLKFFKVEKIIFTENS